MLCGMTNTTPHLASAPTALAAADQIVALFYALRDARVADEEAIFAAGQARYEWTDPQVGARFIAALRTAEVHVVRQLAGFTAVVGSLADHADGHVWGYVVGELLDTAASYVDLAPVAVAEPEIGGNGRFGSLRF